MLRVANLQRSVDFYTQGLGMQVLRTSDNPDYRYSLAFVGFDGGNPGQSEIELMQTGTGEPLEHGTAFGHISIAVPDADAACQRIRAAGGTVVREPGPLKGGTGSILAFVSDPDGYTIELVQRPDDAGKES
jgi:lactoylglutathione lyase